MSANGTNGNGSSGDTLINKYAKDRIDGLYKTIGGFLLFMCCGLTGWGANTIVTMKGEVISLQAKVSAIETSRAEEKNDFEKKMDKMETQVNKRLDTIEFKIDRLLNKQP